MMGDPCVFTHNMRQRRSGKAENEVDGCAASRMCGLDKEGENEEVRQQLMQ
jgi:hypothetical protein